MKYLVRLSGLYSQFLAWLMRRIPTERQRLLVLTIVAGGLCGLAAVAFHESVSFVEATFIDRATAAPGHSWIWWTILSPAIGGLAAGLSLYYFVPAAAGSGIRQVKVAFATQSGTISVKETFGKFILCDMQIGTGGSLSVEGPTVHICAGVTLIM